MIVADPWFGPLALPVAPRILARQNGLREDLTARTGATVPA